MTINCYQKAVKNFTLKTYRLDSMYGALQKNETIYFKSVLKKGEPALIKKNIPIGMFFSPPFHIVVFYYVNNFITSELVF